MASTLSAGQTITGLAPKASTSARASSMELTVPSISGTLWGSSTKPVMMTTVSPGWTAAQSTSAACMVTGSPV